MSFILGLIVGHSVGSFRNKKNQPILVDSSCGYCYPSFEMKLIPLYISRTIPATSKYSNKYGCQYPEPLFVCQNQTNSSKDLAAVFVSIAATGVKPSDVATQKSTRTS